MLITARELGNQHGLFGREKQFYNASFSQLWPFRVRVLSDHLTCVVLTFDRRSIFTAKTIGQKKMI